MANDVKKTHDLILKAALNLTNYEVFDRTVSEAKAILDANMNPDFGGDGSFSDAAWTAAYDSLNNVLSLKKSMELYVKGM